MPVIQTNVSFTTTDKKLERLYENAKNTLFSSIKDFANRKLLTDSPNSDTSTLNYSLMTAETLADYDAEIAIDCVSAFLVTRRKDGRLASSLSRQGGAILPSYEVLTGFSFAEEAVKLCYLVKNKISPYSKRLYEALCHFDEYLWARHDLNANGCLEIFDERDTEEGVGAGRFPPLTMMLGGVERSVSPFPVETFDLMAEAYSVRKALSELALMLNKKEEAEAWLSKANAIAEKVSSFLWLGGFNACFDRDYRGSIISTISVNNLFLLYFGVANETMAKAIIQNHILNPKEFWTPMPLATVSPNHSLFDNENEFRGHPRATTYRRAIRAFEKYGYYSILTEIGNKLLCAVGEQNLFPTRFDAITGAPLDTDKQSNYAPTASATLEVIKRFFGVYADRDTLCWGCLGHENAESEYRFTWGNDIYHTETANGITTGYINGNRLFTVTAGTRVFTDIYGTSIRVANATSQTIDCICVCRNQTYSLRLEPNELKALNEK